MNCKPSKFLFYVEREFHIELFKNIINMLNSDYQAEIAIYSPLHQESNFQHPNVGARKDIVLRKCRGEVLWLNNLNDYNPDVTIIADSSYEAIEDKGFIVNIGHGTISKGSFFTDNNLSYRENCADLMAVPGQIHKNILSKYLYKPIEIIGMPKLDDIFNPKLNKIEILKEFGLDINKKTVLIAPTFNPEFSIVPYLQDKINDFIPSDYNVIMKLHGVAFENWQIEYRKLSSISDNFYYYDDYDIAKAFLASDVMISDVSSIVFEFMATGKPALVFNSPIMKQHPKYNEKDIEHKYRNISYEFTNLNDIKQLIPLALNDLNKIRLSTQISNRFVSVTGGSSTHLLIEKIFEHYKPKKDFLYSELPNINEIINKAEDVSVFYAKQIEVSPNTKEYLKNCLMVNKEIDVSIPLYYNHQDSFHNIGFHFPETENLSFEAIKNAISYRNAGQYLKSDKTLCLDCFCCRNSLILKCFSYSKECQIKASLRLFMEFIKNHNLSFALSFDTIVKY